MALHLLPSCAIPIKDETFYVDAGSSGAVTVNFLSPGSTLIPKAQWDAQREGDYCLTPAAWGDIKTEIEELCSKVSCDYQVTQAVSALSERLTNARIP